MLWGDGRSIFTNSNNSGKKHPFPASFTTLLEGIAKTAGHLKVLEMRGGAYESCSDKRAKMKSKTLDGQSPKDAAEIKMKETTVEQTKSKLAQLPSPSPKKPEKGKQPNVSVANAKKVSFDEEEEEDDGVEEKNALSKAGRKRKAGRNAKVGEKQGRKADEEGDKNPSKKTRKK